MSLRFLPTFQLSEDGEAQTLHNELEDGSRSMRATVLSATTVQFSVVKHEEFMGRVVDVTVVTSTWTAILPSKRNDWQFSGALDNFPADRTWSPEPEAGKAVAELIAGLFRGEVSGRTACSMLFELFLHLEIELSGESPWLSQHYPIFFRHYVSKLHKAKLNKVEEVMES